MEQVARWVFNVSWQAGVLIALVLVMRWALGQRLAPGWRCALWLLVGIRLVMPGVVGAPGFSSAFTEVTPPAAISGGLTVTVEKFWDGLKLPANLGVEEHGLKPRATNWGALLVWAWAAGVVMMLGRLAVSNVRLGWRVRGMRRVTDEDVLCVVKACAEEMGVRGNVSVVETAGVRSPAVWGIFRPILMLPAGCDLKGDDLRMVLLHEMAHIRRGDVWVEWAAGALKAMHWFNPLVWIAAAACRADRELACDEAVLRRMDPGRRREYGACLLRVVEAVGGMRAEPAAVGVFGSKGILRRRIDMIAAYRGPRPAAWSFVGLAAFVAVGCAAMTGRNEPATATPTNAAAVEVAAPQRVTDAPVVRVPTRHDLPNEIVTRVYDVRDLLMEIPDFTGPQTDIGLQKAPATRPSITRKERVRQLIRTIEDGVATPTWRSRRGTEGTIRELSGQLIVTHTSERQGAVQKLLEKLREPRELQITVEAFYLDVDPKLLKEMGIIQPAESSRAKGPDARPMMIEPTLTDKAVAMLLKAARESSGATLLTAPRLTMLNGQRARVTVGEPVEYVANYTVVKGNDGERRYEPVKRTATSGIVTEVQSTVSADRQAVTLAVDTTMTKVMKMAAFTFSTPGGHENLPLWEPVASTTAVRTTVSVPAGQTLALTGSAVAADGTGVADEKAGWIRLILFRPTIVTRTTASRQG